MLHCSKLFNRLFHSLPSCPLSNPQPWLFIGLGNPGEKYQFTRHNVGFDMIDTFARSLGISMASIHFKSYFGGGEFEGTPVLLAKPQTYMNLSGESTGPLAAYYKLPLNRVLVIYDDMDLPCGVLRIQPRGGHGHHNGLKNVIYHFHGNREFCRLRVGIGRPPGQMDPKAFLLQNFNKTARVRVALRREGHSIGEERSKRRSDWDGLGETGEENAFISALDRDLRGEGHGFLTRSRFLDGDRDDMGSQPWTATLAVGDEVGEIGDGSRGTPLKARCLGASTNFCVRA